MLAALGRPSGGGAAFDRHGDLGAEVVAVAADGGLLVLGVSPQEPLQGPSAPLTLNLRLDLTERPGANRGGDAQERRTENEIWPHETW